MKNTVVFCCHIFPKRRFMLFRFLPCKSEITGHYQFFIHIEIKDEEATTLPFTCPGIRNDLFPDVVGFNVKIILNHHREFGL